MFSVNEKVNINLPLFKHLAKKKDLDKLIAVLKKCKIPYEIDESSTQLVAPSNRDISYKTNTTIQKIFENDSIEINIIKGMSVPFYFIILPKNHARADNHFFLLRVESFIYKLKTLGYAQYVIYQNHGDKGIKLIPMVNAGIQVDINQKIINALLCYFGEEALLEFDTSPSRNSKSLIDESFQSLYFPRKTIWMSVKNLAHNVNKALISYLINNRVLRASEGSLTILDHATNTVPNKMIIKTPPCAFCQENTIRDQLVFDFGKLLLMLNFRPFAGTKAHFLIIPKRHIEDWSDLRTDERIILTLVVQSLMQSMLENCRVKKADIISYVQNGNQAGQTVSHSHMHLMTTPKYIPYLLDIYYQMIGQKVPALNAQKMATLSDRFKPVLFQALLFNASPEKLLRSEAEQEDEISKAFIMFDAYKTRTSTYEIKESRESNAAHQSSAYTVSRFKPLHSFGNN